MKKLLLLLFFTSSQLVQSQINNSWPDSNVRWVNADYDLEFQTGNPMPRLVLNHSANYCLGNKDTLINSTRYSQIYYCDSIYKGGLRNDNGKVFYWPKDSVQEYLLYDFGAGLGDSIKNIYMESSRGTPPLLYDLQVIQIDTVSYGGRQLRLLYVESGQGLSGTWIEGIGNTQGLFWPPFPNISNYVLELDCFSMSDTTYYPQKAQGSCQKIYVSLSEEHMASQIEVFPNPATDQIQVQLPVSLKIRDIWLLNHMGSTLRNWPVDAMEQKTLSLYGVPAGMYFLRFSTSEKSSVIPLIIK